MFIAIELNGAEINLKFNVFQFQRKKTILYNNYSLLFLKYDTFVYFRQIKMLTKMKEGEKSERETEKEGERQRGREAELVTLKYNGSHHKGAAERGKKVITSVDPLENIYISKRSTSAAI